MSKVLKVLLSLMMVAVLLTATVSAFAAEAPTTTAASPTTKAISIVEVKNAVYTGKKLTPKVTVYDNEGKKVSSKYYKVTVKGKATNAGTYKVTVKATKAPYTGKLEASFKIYKAANPFKIRAKTSFSYSNEDQTASIKVTGTQGAKLTNWSSSKPQVYVSHGKIVIKGGFKGTATLSVATRKTKNYKATRKTIQITVK